MRKLATIRVVSDIRPIPNADAIEVAVVDGWECVVKKGEFAVGDAGVYFEIDSFLPGTDPRFSQFANKFINYNDTVGMRLRTIRLRGQLSQGLLLRVSNFEELSNSQVGDDVTELLGITKWERPIPAELGGNVTGSFPSFIPKTDEERIQNIADKLPTMVGNTYEVTIKLDGSSMTVYRTVINGEIRQGVCSRNWELSESDTNTFWKTAKQYRTLDALSTLGKNLAFQGELIGEGIQGNPEKIKGHKFMIYNIYDIDHQQYLSPVERMMEIQKLQRLGFEVDHVPVFIDEYTLSESDTVASLLQMAEGGSLNPKTNREGLVFKQSDGSSSFKVISNSFLLKGGD